MSCSTRKNLSKIRSRKAEGTPHPLSVTAICSGFRGTHGFDKSPSDRQTKTGTGGYLTAALQSIEFVEDPLDIRRRYALAPVENTQAKANRYADTIALFQALGGGWWNRSDVEADAARDRWGRTLLVVNG